MSMSKTIFRELLDKEASPALGCTEPMMFALAGAITRKHAPGKVLRVDMVGCGLMVTGVQAVGIPNTGGKTGAFLASAVGIVNGDAEACKEVLHNIRPEDVVAAEELIQNAEFTLDMDNSTGKQVYFKLTLTTDEHVATVIFEDEHHTWTYLEADGKVLVDNRKPAGEMLIPANDIDWDVFTIENIYNWCKTADISEFGRAKEAVEMNTKVATDGLENPRGIQTARILRKNVESGFVAEDEITHVLMWGTAGPDARMGGSDYPTMVSTASGNQGLMVVMAPWASAQYRKMSAEDGYRAVAFALLMNTFMKYASKEYVYILFCFLSGGYDLHLIFYHFCRYRYLFLHHTPYFLSYGYHFYIYGSWKSHSSQVLYKKADHLLLERDSFLHFHIQHLLLCFYI